ncbi:MAG: hypothetical protein IKB57_07235 [Bacteroidaceae bacterium]|nr:hypothetical protein [Bacteroidaceae bacterium]
MNLLNNKTMGLFNFWKKKNSPISEGKSVGVSNDTQESKNDLITIVWGTGMPIDVIFNFIEKDFEEIGYKDALVNSDIKYKETKETIIRNELKMLFKRVLLKYQSDIRDIDVRIKMAEESYAFSSVSMLLARKKTFEEHISEIVNMEQMLEENGPKITTMIESYRRGFLKGINIQTVEFIQQK